MNMRNIRECFHVTGQPMTDFLRYVPLTWDELQGDILDVLYVPKYVPVLQLDLS